MSLPFSQGGRASSYGPSDHTIEEKLAGGADVDDLVASGELYDDYDPKNDPDYFFTSMEDANKRVIVPMTDEEMKFAEARMLWWDEYRLGKNTTPTPPGYVSKKQQ